MQLKDIKVKTMFNNSAKINCISKDLANKINLIIRQNVSILLIKITRVRICFEEIIKDAKISIKEVIIYTFIFVVS